MAHHETVRHGGLDAAVAADAWAREAAGALIG
jgi:hypothetical protein